MPENKFVLISLLKYSHMHSSTILSAGVAAALKTTSLGPIVDFIQSINDQSTKIALTQIAKDHEERLKMLEGTSGINLQILEKIKVLFQGKGGVEELKEVVDFQRNGEHACLLLPGLLLDDDIRSKFLVNLSHAGDGAKIIEVGNKPALEIGRPDLLHFLIKDTREKILLCQTPVGFVNLALEWQKERTRKQRGNHELGIEPFEKFDFVYDKDGVPRTTLMNTQKKSQTTPIITTSNKEKTKDHEKKIRNMNRTAIGIMLLTLSGLSVLGIKRCEQETKFETPESVIADNLDKVKRLYEMLTQARVNAQLLRYASDVKPEVEASLTKLKTEHDALPDGDTKKTELRLRMQSIQAEVKRLESLGAKLDMQSLQESVIALNAVAEGLDTVFRFSQQLKPKDQTAGIAPPATEITSVADEALDLSKPANSFTEFMKKINKQIEQASMMDYRARQAYLCKLTINELQLQIDSASSANDPKSMIVAMIAYAQETAYTLYNDMYQIAKRNGRAVGQQ